MLFLLALLPHNDPVQLRCQSLRRNAAGDGKNISEYLLQVHPVIIFRVYVVTVVREAVKTRTKGMVLFYIEQSAPKSLLCWRRVQLLERRLSLRCGDGARPHYIRKG